MAFIYADDLWIADRAGGTARRLTTHEGTESNPHFSPDGAVDRLHRPLRRQRRRLPHPRRRRFADPADLASRSTTSCEGFTPDGSAVLFCFGPGVPHQSLRPVLHRAGRRRLADPVAPAVGVQGQLFTRWSVHRLQPAREAFRQWKNYRGGTASRIWIYDTSDHSVRADSAARGSLATTSTPPGSATPSISSPTATASSTSSPSIANRARSSS